MSMSMSAIIVPVIPQEDDKENNIARTLVDAVLLISGSPNLISHPHFRPTWLISLTPNLILPP